MQIEFVYWSDSAEDQMTFKVIPSPHVFFFQLYMLLANVLSWSKSTIYVHNFLRTEKQNNYLFTKTTGK